MRRLRLILLILILAGAQSSVAQKTLLYKVDEATYKDALHLFDLKKYAAAQKRFKEVMNAVEALSEIQMSAEYYHAVCALELFNNDCEQLFIDFIQHHPQSPKIRLAGFQLGRFYYRNEDWRKSLNWFTEVDVNELDSIDVPEFYFKKGYCQYKLDELKEAQVNFEEARHIESIYQSPAEFYFSYIAYSDGDNETALKGFESLRNDESFGGVVPFYIIQLYYLQGRYDQILEFGPQLIEEASPKRLPEIARIVAEAYYRKDDYKNAIQYLELFIEKGFYVDSTANYQLAYSYYQEGELAKAVPYFQKASDLDSEIGQLALFYLGDIYLKQNNKNAARSAFRFASKPSYNRDIKENALFNYAKLSFELDIDPYHESIIALENYIDEFPNSSKVKEAQKYLLHVYLNTKNYQRAIVALEEMDKTDNDIKFAYQKIAFYRGIELFNNEKVGFTNKDNSNYKGAIVYFSKSLDYPIDPKITAEAIYWKAEAYYRIGEYKVALNGFKEFKQTSGAILTPLFKEVDYQIGYCHLASNDYGPAIRAFRKYVDAQTELKTRKVNDALIRTGDSYLIIKGRDDLILATKFYDKAIQLNFESTDYAYFQKAQALLLLNEYDKQAKALRTLVENYPNSKYLDEALYYLGETYLVNLNDLDQAVKYFTEVVEHNNGDVLLVQRAHNGLANTYLNRSNYEKALTHFENAIALNPRSSYAFDAIAGHQAVCVENIGDFQRHQDFRNNVGLPDLSESSKDSSVFNAARKFYVEQEYPTAIKNLKQYINAFPKALFVTRANFYIAESYIALEQESDALPFYENVIALPPGEFTERSFYQAARINFKETQYNKAIQRYLHIEENSNFENYVLEARIGLMRSYSELGQHEEAIKYGNLVKQSVKVSNLVKNEATLILGKSFFSSYQYDDAIVAFRELEQNTQGEMGAEAKYHVAYIWNLQERFEASTAEVYALAKKYPSYKKWVTKGFLVMSDNFLKQKDYFQAKYILKTITENYQGADLVKEANEKLAAIREIEEAETRVEELVEEPIRVGESNEESQKLYESEIEGGKPTDSLNVVPEDTSEIKGAVPEDINELDHRTQE